MSTVAESIAGFEGSPPGGIAAAVRRRAVPAALASAAVLAATLLIALLWPATYRSAGTLLVELPADPEAISRAGGITDPAMRIESISLRVMTAAELDGIARRHGLYEAGRDDRGSDALAARMRRDIRIEVSGAPAVGPRGGTHGSSIAFTVGYESRSAEVAARIASELVTLFLRAGVAQPDRAAAETPESLARDAERLRQRIADIEHRVVAFRQRNADHLPESADANLVALSRATADLRDTDARIDEVEREAHDATDREATLRRLEEARSWLAMDRDRLAPDHPDVRRLEREVAGLEKRLQRAPSSDEHARLMARSRELKAQIEALQQAQLQMPVVAREYAALMQEIQDEQDRLDAVRRQQLAAGLAASETTRSRGERFTLIDAPIRPEAPVRPNRTAILAAGLLAAIAAAAAALGILDLRETRVRGRRDVISLTGAPPLAVVPWVAPSQRADA